jgi:hypothetical protein
MNEGMLLYTAFFLQSRCYGGGVVVVFGRVCFNFHYGTQ